jgi:PAS domain S-box-containing protein
VCDSASTNPPEKLSASIEDSQRCKFLLNFIDSIGQDIVFYMLDASGNFTFVSNSVQTVLGYTAPILLGKHISENLTEAFCNDGIRSNSWKLKSDQKMHSSQLEMRDKSGLPTPLRYWQTTIFDAANPIGVSGMFQRLTNSEPLTISTDWTPQEHQLMSRVASLSQVEREVVQMACDGHMNKSMASLLNVAVRTIESRRSRAMIKLGAKSISDLVQVWLTVRNIESRGYRREPQQDSESNPLEA